MALSGILHLNFKLKWLLQEVFRKEKMAQVHSTVFQNYLTFWKPNGLSMVYIDLLIKTWSSANIPLSAPDKLLTINLFKFQDIRNLYKNYLWLIRVRNLEFLRLGNCNLSRNKGLASISFLSSTNMIDLADFVSPYLDNCSFSLQWYKITHFKFHYL